jgi:hypothetical protein
MHGGNGRPLDSFSSKAIKSVLTNGSIIEACMPAVRQAPLASVRKSSESATVWEAPVTLSMPIDGASWGEPGLLSTKREGRPHVS